MTERNCDEHGVRYVQKPEHFLKLGEVEISPLLAMVNRLSDRAWEAADSGKENRTSVLGATQHVIFRFTPGNLDPRKVYSDVSWDLWRPSLLPIMQEVMAFYDHHEPRFSKVMLARMRPGGIIKSHVDGLGSNLTSHKMHIPLITNPDVLFYVNGNVMHLEAGTAYEVNNIVSHGVKNLGTSDRIHLIFEHYDAAMSPKIRT